MIKPLTRGEEKVRGVFFDFGNGAGLIIPPLNLKALESLGDGLSNIESGNALSQLRVVVDATYLSLKRNYPEIEREEIAEMIDLGNMVEVLQCVMDVSGLKRKAQEAAEEAGKTQAQ